MEQAAYLLWDYEMGKKKSIADMPFQIKRTAFLCYLSLDSLINLLQLKINI